jgi:glycosyltransferase involved in cell wall biosynthesis
MRVSVIIPLYNKAAYIRRALDSVLAQTHGDFEILVVDDGSTDGGDQIVEQYADSRICLIQQANAGVSAARNRGLREAGSEWIALLDADDEWTEDFLATVLSLREQFPDAAVWGTHYAMMRPDGCLYEFPLNEEVRCHPGGQLINFFRFSTEIEQPCNASSTLLRKSALLQAGGFPEDLVRLEDTDTLFRLALRHPVAYCPQVKSIYHMEAENRSDAYLYRGNFPFFKHARDWISGGMETNALGEDVLQYLAFMHTRGLYRNWLAGDPCAMREIIRDCKKIRGYQLKCFVWNLLVWVPHPWVLALWRFQSRLRGGPGQLPPVRSIYRKS